MLSVVLISILAFLYYIDSTWKPIKSFSLIAMSCIICAVAEIKVYFVLFVFSVILIIVLRKNTVREKIKIIVVALMIIILLFLAYKILLMILPQNVYSLLSISGYLSYDSRTTYAGRTNTIPFIYHYLFNDDFFTSLFGTGLGSNATNFIYELGKSFSELGFIGLGLLLLFLFSVFWQYFNPKMKESRTQERLMSGIYSVVFILGMIAWNCAFTRYVYFNFFFLSLGNVKWIKTSKKIIGVKIA